MSLSRRFGIFLIMIGVGLIGYFVLTDLALQAVYGSLLIGTLALLGGIAMLIANPGQEARSNPRFRTLNKVMKRDEKIEGKKK